MALQVSQGTGGGRGLQEHGFAIESGIMLFGEAWDALMQWDAVRMQAVSSGVAGDAGNGIDQLHCGS